MTSVISYDQVPGNEGFSPTWGRGEDGLETLFGSKKNPVYHGSDANTRENAEVHEVEYRRPNMSQLANLSPTWGRGASGLDI